MSGYIPPAAIGFADQVPSGLKENPEGIKKAAAEFESLFLNEMLKVMRSTVQKSELFHGGSGEDIYTSLMDMELARDMASGGGIGLAEILLSQIDPAPNGANGDESGKDVKKDILIE